MKVGNSNSNDKSLAGSAKRTRRISSRSNRIGSADRCLSCNARFTIAYKGNPLHRSVLEKIHVVDCIRIGRDDRRAPPW